jgi:hypothetical protein
MEIFCPHAPVAASDVVPSICVTVIETRSEQVVPVDVQYTVWLQIEPLVDSSKTAVPCSMYSVYDGPSVKF